MKKMSFILLTLLLCLTACTQKIKSNAKWVQFAQDKSDKLFYTLEKMDKTDKGVIKIWVKTVYGKSLNIDSKEAVYAKNMYMINCAANTYKMNVGFYFSADDEIISKTTSTQPDVMPQILDKSSREFTFKPISTAHEEYFPILPKSPVDALKLIACSQQK